MPPKRGVSGPAGARAPKKAKTSSAAASKAAPKPAVVDIEDCCFTPEEVAQVRESLLDWYDANHRILPWRRNPHSKLDQAKVEAEAAAGRTGAPLDMPLNQFVYSVWVCEVMSQQTQVPRVVEYFTRWTQKWPTVERLAQASQEEVNDMWAGLGYYRRARFLLDGAKYVVESLGGTFPITSKELQKIPGVGAYTGNAIASIAGGERVAVVDGNVVRVLARMRRVGADPRSAASVKLFGDLAASLLDPSRPGDFNQAVMELGATVCLPNAQPLCVACPVSASCAAYAAVQQYEQRGGKATAPEAPRVTDYPAKVEKAEKKEVTVAVAVVQLAPPGKGASDLAASKFLLVKRPKDGLLAGLWEFPLQQVPAGAKKAQLQQAASSYLASLLGVELEAEGSPYQQQQQEEEGEGEQGDGSKESGGGGSGAGSGGAAAIGAAAAAGQGMRLLKRVPLGELVHVFSHIRMTLKAERITLQGDLSDLPAQGSGTAGEGEASATQWLSYAELDAKGLSSSVRKVLTLLQQAAAREEGGVHAMLVKGAAKRKKAASEAAPGGE